VTLISVARDALPRSILPHVLKNIPKYEIRTPGGVPSKAKATSTPAKSATIRRLETLSEIVVNNSEGSTHIVNDRSTRPPESREEGDDKWVPLKRVTLRCSSKALKFTIARLKLSRWSRAGRIHRKVVLAAGRKMRRAIRGRRSAAFEPPPMDVPDGFEVYSRAASPLVEHPMRACLDDRGRLFISESDGINAKLSS